MKKKTLLVVGCLSLIGGWFSAFVLNTLTPQSNFYIIAPTLLLGTGMGLTHKAVGGKKTAIALVFTAMFGLLLLNQLFPQRAVSISAFKQRLKAGARGTMIPLEVKAADRSGPFAVARQLEVFAPLKIHLYARLPGTPEMLTSDQDGHIYVTIPDLGAIYRLTDDNYDGFADSIFLYYVGLDRPSGLAWLNGRLYVAQPDQLLELSGDNGRGQPARLRVVIDDLPDDGGHWRRPLVAADDGFLYLAVGSRCNACREANPLRATVLKIDPRKETRTVYARGLRSAIGLTWSSVDQTLWCTDIGRNDLGPNRPPDEINRLTVGHDYGWPACYGNRVADPQFGTTDICRQTQPSSVDLPAHSIAMGITTGQPLHAEKPAQNSLYVSLHGSFANTYATPGKVIRVPFVQGQLSGSGKEFIRGWGKGADAWGAPAAVLSGPNGYLYVADDIAAAIYRISWQPQE